MTATPSQLTLELPHRSALGAEDFFVSGSNGAAVEFVDRWPDWPSWAGVVVGPQGAGKSHLAHVWRLRSGAARIEAPRLSESVVKGFESKQALVVEDLHLGIADERALFHLLNLAREHRLSILLTSRKAPGEIDIALPDLRSRLRALPLVRIEAPDEALLRAVIVKLFADRQIAVEPHVIAYLALHMERSMAAALRIVALVDRMSLARQRKVTRPLVAEALEALDHSETD